MEFIELSEKELFFNFLEIEIQDNIYDLHNDFNFQEIKYSQENNSLILGFFGINNAVKISVNFIDFEIIDLSISLEKELTLDTFYRGRYESDGILYDEVNGKKCFYLDFEHEEKIHILASRLLVVFET